MQNKSKTIAMIGAGIMGSGMAARLLIHGHKVRLYARSPEKLDLLPEDIKTIVKGPSAEIFDSISSAVTGADLVVLCLTEDDAVRNAFFRNGLLDVRPNHIIDTGTTSPELTLEMFTSAKSQGIVFFDSPMTGSKLAAQSGQILFMTGGDRKGIEELNYFFEACGKKTIHCGPVGSAQRAKIALNMIQAGMFQVYMEGFQLATKDGISASTFFDILKQSAASSPLLEFKLGNVMRKDYSAHFTLKNMNKDRNHAMQRAKELKAVLPLSSALKSIYEAGMGQGLEDEDFCSLAKVNELLNGNEIRP
ncbi:NAD(P)-dependent oxidoreductase [Leptospira ilyithenensis]|uniref:NAD(P)-dependent oxidoreductase n=1 Tax=Leptospira ilyithenensis TaxID=2484901 RepID=A0A4R9LTG9_9LEPT|nr:NAD(P)-dependent oxidoreductase [Leptospira ilyithenensis]TGN10453.1 NAD(P)-dependent oxidoreductase [Leptospira ilyithenensis]